ncbi:MAG: D-alanine--D-alanine ligase [Bacteroidaceae bacterium]|nr:D-alanine--D-alanine ligase [Bacteroidaceae bacterium]
MNNKRTIAIVCGGDSAEHDVSMRSAEGIESFLDKERYNVYKVEIHARHWEAILQDGTRSVVDRNDFSFKDGGQIVKPDYAYITIHGAPGENGILQGYFDLIGMPYSTCNVLIEAMTYDKFVLNNYMRGLGVSVADSLTVKIGHEREVSDEDIISRIGLPCFVKPARGGSSFGTTKVKTPEQLRPAIEVALKEGEDVMVEAFMQGTELTCGCYKTRTGGHVFPVTEVVSQNEFFDYDAKYNGQVAEITPARISERLTERVQQLTSMIYDILGCHGIIRIDYIITEGDKINLLEINTTPGMTATSFIPQQVRAAGLDIKDVLTEIIEDNIGLGIRD